MVSNNWFDISNDGWRRMNAGRHPYELVRELLQNILDEDFTKARIDFCFDGGIFHLSAEDDVATGISDKSLVTTVFMTDKEDSHLKRGRKGRGLKELLSVVKSATVETVGVTIHFNSDGTREEASNNRTKGTRISCKIVNDIWNEMAVGAIQTYLLRTISDRNIKVNGRKVKSRKFQDKLCGVSLRTQIIKDGVQRDVSEKADVVLYKTKGKRSDLLGWLFEMGIPIMAINCPFDIDVQQRVPMNDNRDQVGSDYIDELFANIINSLYRQLTTRDYLSWLSGSIGRCRWRLNQIAIANIINRIAGGVNRVLVKSKDKRANDRAKQMGMELFDASSLPTGINVLVSDRLERAERYVSRQERNAIPLEVSPTEVEKRFIDATKSLVTEVLHNNIDVVIVEKKDYLNGQGVAATHTRVSRKSKISYNRLKIRNVFNKPYSVKAIDILIHELAHAVSSEHESFKYVNEITRLAGEFTAHFIKKSSGARAGSRGVAKKGETLKKRLLDYMKTDNSKPKLLEQIYNNLDLVTIGEKAAVRGIINRECKGENAIFKRIEGIAGSYCVTR